MPPSESWTVGETLEQAPHRLFGIIHAEKIPAVATQSSNRDRAICSPDDQLCAAFGADGIIGLARKIFPTDHDTRKPERAVTPRLADCDCPGRIVSLSGGRRAVLSACYDVFGFHEKPDSNSARTRAIRWIRVGSRLVGTEGEGFADFRRTALAAWQAHWRGAGADLALAAVHGFEMPGRDGYWQRHGMACAAAVIGGAAIGAAHFEECLPEPDSSTLVAAGVPMQHLKAGLRRRAHPSRRGEGTRPVCQPLPAGGRQRAGGYPRQTSVIIPPKMVDFYIRSGGMEFLGLPHQSKAPNVSMGKISTNLQELKQDCVQQRLNFNKTTTFYSMKASKLLSIITIYHFIITIVVK